MKIYYLESIFFSSKPFFFLTPPHPPPHFFHVFRAWKSNFKHSSFIAKGLEEFGDLQVLTSFVTSQNSFEILCIRLKVFLVTKLTVNPLSTNPTKWSNTLKQFVGCWGRIAWVCLTILWGWRSKGWVTISTENLTIISKFQYWSLTLVTYKKIKVYSK